MYMCICVCVVYMCARVRACVYTYVCTYLCHMEKSEDNFQTQFLISVLLKQALSFCHCAVTARLGDQ